MKKLSRLLIPILALSFMTPVFAGERVKEYNIDYVRKCLNYQECGVHIGGDVETFEDGSILVKKDYTIDEDPDTEVREFYYYKDVNEKINSKRPLQYWFDFDGDGKESKEEYAFDFNGDGVIGWLRPSFIESFRKSYFPEISQRNCC